MENEKYLRILTELAAWRVVPGFKPGPDVLERLKKILGDVPCSLSGNGDILIGHGASGRTGAGGVCFRAPLAGGGGRLNISRDGKFFFSEVSGFGQLKGLLGRKLGVFAPMIGEKICDLEVERVFQTRDRQAVCFYASPEALRAVKQAGRAVVTHPSGLEVASGRLNSWNLSSLVNAALVIFLMKELGGRAGVTGLLYSGRDLGPGALFPVDFVTLRSDAVKQDYGYAFHVPGQSPPGELEQRVSELTVPSGARGLRVGIRIENPENLAPNETFSPESVPSERLDRYISFAVSLADAISGAQLPAAVGDVAAGDCEIFDEAPVIAEIAAAASDFSDFLSTGMPKLLEIYGRHGLVSNAVKSSTYENLLQALRSKSFDVAVDAAQLKSWAAECSVALRRLIPGARDRKIRIVTVLMLPVPSASSGSEELTLFLSPDKIGKGKIKAALLGELAFCMARAALEDLRLPPRLVKFYAEGLRYALPAAMLGGGLAEAIGFSQAKFDDFSRNSAAFREKLELYLSGEMFFLHEGKYHRYFKDREFYDPYTLFYGAEGGYGRFLAALEVSELLASGKFNEKILSH